MIEFEHRPSPNPLPSAQRAAVLAAPGFGQVFTDHMITLRWSAASGWHDGRLEPFAALCLPPSAAVFHYGQEIFEGMKAYRHDSGVVGLFRPEANAARFNRSARRLAMPDLPEEVFVRAVEHLVERDADWVPSGAGNSLYLRPMMIATQQGLGFTHPSDSYLFCVIASPATAYFAGGGDQLRALDVWLSEAYTRAAPGGTGFAKAGGNYAGAFAAGQEATAHGCDQVIWLDSAEHAWVEEMGGMNLFLVEHRDGRPARIVTPRLTGTLLPGVTRDSLLALAPLLGFDTDEGRISVRRWQEDCRAGTVREAFACGTAAVIAPIGHVRGRAADWAIGDGQPGQVTVTLRDELLGIQHGVRPDPFGWVHKVC